MLVNKANQCEFMYFLCPDFPLSKKQIYVVSHLHYILDDKYVSDVSLVATLCPITELMLEGWILRFRDF